MENLESSLVIGRLGSSDILVTSGNMVGQNQGTAPNMDQFEAYFRRADLDKDGRISGPDAVAFFQGANLPKQVLAQIWMYADQNRTGFLGKAEFYNALKLVTVAQSKRELTPDIVKAALFGPASTKIPAPQINLSATRASQQNLNASTPALQLSSAAPTTTQSTDIGVAQGFPSQQSQLMRPPGSLSPITAFQEDAPSQLMPGGGTMAASRPPSSNLSTDLFGGRMGGSSAGLSSQVPNKGINLSMSQDGFGWAESGPMPVQPRPQAPARSQPVVPKPNDATSVSNQAGTRDSKAFAVSGNGFVSNSLFANTFSTTSPQQNQDSLVFTSSSSNSTMSSAIVPASSGSQPTVKTNLPVLLQSAPTRQPVGGQHQQVQSTVKQNQQLPGQSSATFTSSSFPVGAGMSPSGQSQLPWPRMTQSDFQKYRKVFLQVDTDRDGKITGEQARNLFLSWRLPREVLKQVWDLSDQDNDSMLSLREFCIALYLMERHREGRPLSTTLPSSIVFNETLFPASNQPPVSYTNANWRPTPGLQQAQGMPGVQPVTSAARGKPPRPVPISEPGEAIQPKQHKPKVPVLEKHLVDQLSTEEQDSLNSKFQEATEAEKKVEELENEILDSRQKIEFYQAKMQELVLYKSRCDNRLNEITERTSADKREAESLAKKYEEKYRQVGDVASKLTIEEATFRDIQEKKMELYRAVIKLEQDGNDGIQARADQIQSNLEELVKALNERCKTYGLRAKPTSLVELPFGWQSGIQGGAADWDEVWDNFEDDEGFTFVKELTLDVQNVIAPPRPKSSLVPKKTSSMDEVVSAVRTSNADDKSEKVPRNEDQILGELMRARNEDMVRGSPRSLGRIDAPESPSKIFDDSQPRKNLSGEGSPHATETQSEHERAESVLSGDRGFGEQSWDAYDTQYDTDAAWDVNSVSSKDIGHESSFFDSDNWNLNPIRTGSTHTDNMFQKGFTFDSVPSTPLFDSTSTPHGGNIFQKSSFAFADSVPSTPMYNPGNSPRRFSEVSEEHSFDSLSRFDSFNMHHSGSFPQSFSRFDSMRSTRDGDYDHGFSQPRDSLSLFDNMHGARDSEFDHGLFQTRDYSPRFDSMHSTRDSEYDHGFFQPHDRLTRFDSMRSTRDSENDHGLFQPHESFRSLDSNRSIRDSDYDHGSFHPRESFTRFDSIRSTRDSDYSHMFTSFDGTDPFGSSDPFKAPLESQTPRRDTDSWKAF